MAKRASPSLVISHWYQMIDGLQIAPQEFYTSVEAAVKDRQVSDVALSRVEYPEGGPFSPKREYLRILRREHTFDVCGAPFGRGFFFSWWLGEIPSGCLMAFGGIPVIGAIVERFIRPSTYYRIDTALMFQSAVHGAVLEIVDKMTTAKGLRALTELERKPILRGFRG